MAYNRFCSPCGKDITCKENLGTTPGSHHSKLQLSCPDCDRVLATVYDREMDIRPVESGHLPKG